MTYIIEFIEEKTEQFRAVRVESDEQRWVVVDLMKQHGLEPKKVLKIYMDCSSE